MKITFNAPVTLTFALLATLIYFVFTHGLPPEVCILRGTFNFSNWKEYLSLFGYTVGHGSTEHLIGNLSLILLLGPILEEKYGSKKLFTMIMLTAFLTAIVHIMFFSHNLIGASGFVFMMIVLVSLTNVKSGEIPITFILIMILYIGQEVYKAFDDDQVSQFAHIFGGILGAIFGYSFKPSGKANKPSVSIKKDIV